MTLPPEVAALVEEARRTHPSMDECNCPSCRLCRALLSLLASPPAPEPPGVTGSEFVAAIAEARAKLAEAGERVDASPPAPVEDDGLDAFIDYRTATDDSGRSVQPNRVTKWLRELQARRRGAK